VELPQGVVVELHNQGEEEEALVLEEGVACQSLEEAEEVQTYSVARME